MQTRFRPEQLRDPDMRESEHILRTCVHCGFCTATCPTYQLLGDELDGPRGRIYLIRSMLEEERVSPRVVRHIDRCLSCLSCMTTCPSGVHYMHLVDHARSFIERHYRRPFADRWMRSLLATVLPRPGLFRMALLGAAVLRPFRDLFGGRLGAMLALAPRRLPAPSPVDRPQTVRPAGPRRGRVALLSGCAQQVIAPEINEATVRLLLRMGLEVVVARGATCCGALTHHMGREGTARRTAARTIEAWWRQHLREPLDAIVVTASGCGTTVKDYGFLFRNDPGMAEKASGIASLARDVTELVDQYGLPEVRHRTGLVVAYHSACSMQHGQKITTLPARLLQEAGFVVRDVPEGHLCCGSAGTYNLLQPRIAQALGKRKVANIERTRPDVIASGNIGCNTQIARESRIPVCHTVELLDWATGGPAPAALRRRGVAGSQARDSASDPVRRPVPALY